MLNVIMPSVVVLTIVAPLIPESYSECCVYNTKLTITTLRITFTPKMQNVIMPSVVVLTIVAPLKPEV
jgi:hypothetical protein